MSRPPDRDISSVVIAKGKSDVWKTFRDEINCGKDNIRSDIVTRVDLTILPCRIKVDPRRYRQILGVAAGQLPRGCRGECDRLINGTQAWTSTG